MVLLDTTAAVQTIAKSQDFGVFTMLTDYGALGLIVLALGFVAWKFIDKKIKEADDLRDKLDKCQQELYKKK